MEHHFEMELEALKEKLLAMASHAGEAVELSVQSLLERNAELARRVREDDDILDQFELEIDDTIVLLLTKAPLAMDLRLVRAGMKISQNLERVGDEASKITKCARALAQEAAVEIDLEIPRMRDLSLAMLKEATRALAEHDPNTARAVIPRDKEVDALNKQIYRNLIAYMVKTPDAVERGLHWIVAAKSLERIADHAKNIAEQVVFLYEAQDIRHLVKA